MEHNCSAGPWELDSAKDGDTRYYIIHGQLPKGINGEFGYPIADTMNRHHCISPEEDRANGLVMAAAWEMLEALNKIRNLERRNFREAWDMLQEVDRLASTAIRKTEGR